jgi:hypothetical protein
LINLKKSASFEAEKRQEGKREREKESFEREGVM